LFQQTVEREIAPFQKAPVHRRPLGKNDRPGVVTGGLQRKRVAVDDVPFQDVPDGFAAVIVGLVFEQSQVDQIEYPEKPLAALPDVIFENIDAVEGRHGQDGVAFKVELACAVARLDHAKLAFEDFGQEVSGPASRFEEARVNPLGLGLHQVQHGIDLALSGQHLSMIRDPLF